MKKFLVTGDARVALAITVEAENEDEAHDLVAQMSWDQLSEHPDCTLDTGAGLILDLDMVEEG